VRADRSSESTGARLAWLTDIHVDHVDDGGAALWRGVAGAQPSGVVVTGDIATARTVRQALELAADAVAVPIYFVLGNHDFYGGSIARVRAEMRELTRTHARLRWLPEAGVVSLGAGVAIVGHDGWADARLGDVDGSPIALTDWIQIEELTGISHEERIARLRSLGDEAAAHLARVLAEAAATHAHVIVLVHPPPFAEACRYYGLRSPAKWLPHLACAAAGEALVAAATRFADRRFTVLCGHTHSPGEAQVLPNLRVLTGGAEYVRPEVQRVLTVP